MESEIVEVRGLIDLLFDLLNGKIKIRWVDCEELVLFAHYSGNTASERSV
jgi:hypothetical protein